MSEQDFELNHLPSQEELIEFYRLSQQNDPTSASYARVSVRPRVRWLRASMLLLTSCLLSAAVGLLMYVFTDRVVFAVCAAVGFLLIMTAIHAKPLLIFSITVYQRLAPLSVRERCRYEPSCSQYMMQAVGKYGFFKGLKKGLRRWRSCKPPNGGYDLP